MMYTKIGLRFQVSSVGVIFKFALVEGEYEVGKDDKKVVKLLKSSGSRNHV